MANRLPAGTTPPRGLPPPELIRWPLLPARALFELKYGKGLVETVRRAGNVPVYGSNGRCGWHNERPCCTDQSLGGEDWTVYQGPVPDPGQPPCRSKQTKIAVITSRSSGTE